MNYNKYKIGVLALQGDYERHQHQLQILGVDCCHVKLPSDLEDLDAVIIPGGESTTMNILLDRFDLREPLVAFGRSKPMYGTCAGMIMLAKQIVDNQAGVETLGLIDIDVIRTGYGRQVHSTEKQITVDLGNGLQTLKATFIRAPVVTRVGGNVKVIVQDENTPLLVSEGRILAGSFHTELDDDTTLLEYFIREFVAGR